MLEHLPQHIAYDHFRTHRPTIEAARDTNEATTRLRAIDTFLFDVLGWRKQEVDAETYCRDTGYADYTLKIDGSIACVLEAKRDSAFFALPEHAYPPHPVGLAYVTKQSSDAATALRQACGYAAALGARYVAISNGTQWLVTLTYIPNVPFEDRSIVVFECLDAIERRFSAFCEAFSRDGMASNHLANSLVETRKAPAPSKLSTSIPGYPVSAYRNVLVNEIDWVLSIVWDSTNQDDADEAFLRRCYVKPEPADTTLTLATEGIQQHRRDDELAEEHSAIQSGDVPQVLADTNPERPIVVLGRVGHGKSMFLDYLRLIAGKLHLEKYLQIDIDFLDRPTDPTNVESFVFDTVDQQLLRTYALDVNESAFVRAALHAELARFRRTLRGSRFAPESPEQAELELDFLERVQRDQYKYFIHAIYHLKRSHHYSIALFFDNLDRRPDSLQEQAFLHASALARDWGCLVFVCLRPGTMYRSTGRGVLDTIAPKTIHIVAPRPEIVLKKRFEFAASVARGEQVRSADLPRAAPGKNVSAELPSAAAFFECCRNSFFKNKELSVVFASVSNGDIRKLLRYVRQFVTSGHLNTKKICEHLDAGGYVIAAHEAIRALLFGNSWHYDPSQSPFMNVFDIEHADKMEHFCKILVLSYLDRLSATSTTHGFAHEGELTRYLCQLGYTPELVGVMIGRLAEANCVENRYGDQLIQEDAPEYRITWLGRYLLNTLVKTFVYLDAVLVDTPIVDDYVRETVQDVTSIGQRIERARAFLDYLNDCSATLQDADALALWKRIYTTIASDIKKVSIRVGYTVRRD